MTMAEKRLNPSTCYNLSFFKEIMKELRRVDDNIIPRMNTTDTHSEKACGEFFSQLAESYRKREDAVDYCLKVMDEQIDKKTKLLEEDPDDFDTKSSLFSDETKVYWGASRSIKDNRRMIANELIVEDIVRARSLQVFKTKCKIFDTSSLELKS